MSVGDLARDYVCVCHGLMCPSIKELRTHVHSHGDDGSVVPGESAAPGAVRRDGKPSLTKVKVVAHASRQADPFSLAILRLGTGRRHQIRVQTAHVGHPILCDGKYGADEDVFESDLEWCPRNFLHRYRLAFLDGDGEARDALAPLPCDLKAALRELVPKTRISSEALWSWRGDAPPRSWDDYEPLPDEDLP
eukprot:NODE_10437_length_1352_cov_3.504490.p1 GENE.NODE_10437_length_1352_cov_3.504490~~NODE_10437_length_1352_cov_3.504490.p1  ORF type:complete len:192 (-),score=50.79 NODE_10437_length_1352_cov_3.504490:441-1016(-)